MLDILDNTCILLAKAEQAHLNHTKAQFSQAGGDVTPVQWLVLSTLFTKDSISITDLAKRCYLDNSTITGVIDRLEKAGYVARERVESDRRAYNIVLLPKAYEIREKYSDITQDIYSNMISGCTNEEIAVFRKVLLNIFNVLKN